MSFLGGLGKGLLKVGKAAAPALNFVPGGQFINAGIGALDTKVNQGGSWKDALKSGLMSGITGGLSKGIGPSGGGNLGNRSGTPGGAMNFGGQGGGGGFLGGLKSMFGGGQGNIASDIGAVDRSIGGGSNPFSQYTLGMGPRIGEEITQGGGGGMDWKKVLGAGLGGGLLGYGLGKMGGGGGGNDGMWGPQTRPFTPSSGGMGITSGYDQSNPNLAYALTQGRNEALQGRGLAPQMPMPGGSGSGTAVNRRQRM